jgi:hypothetical protein
MTLFRWMTDENNDEMECALCNSHAPLSEESCLSMPRRGEKHFVCEVCFCTEVGNALEYRQSHAPEARLLAQVANLILNKLDPGRR